MALDLHLGRPVLLYPLVVPVVIVTGHPRPGLDGIGLIMTAGLVGGLEIAAELYVSED